MVILRAFYKSDNWYANWLAYFTIGMMLLVLAYEVMRTFIKTVKMIIVKVKNEIPWVKVKVENEVIQELINIQGIKKRRKKLL